MLKSNSPRQNLSKVLAKSIENSFLMRKKYIATAQNLQSIKPFFTPERNHYRESDYTVVLRQTQKRLCFCLPSDPINKLGSEYYAKYAIT